MKTSNLLEFSGLKDFFFVRFYSKCCQVIKVLKEVNFHSKDKLEIKSSVTHWCVKVVMIDWVFYEGSLFVRIHTLPK